MIPANQTQAITGVIVDGIAELKDEANGSLTTLVVKDADPLPDALMVMMDPNATPCVTDTFSVHPEATGAKIESPPLSGKRFFVPWRFILPLVNDLRSSDDD